MGMPMHALCDSTTKIIQSSTIFRDDKLSYFIWCFIWTNELEEIGLEDSNLSEQVSWEEQQCGDVSGAGDQIL